MAVVIERPAPKRRAYPWTEWTDGRAYAATSGFDFFCSVEGFKASLYSHSRRYKIPVVVWSDSPGVVGFQFTPPKPRKKPSRKAVRK